MPFKLTLVAAVLVAIPYILKQIWGFIAPRAYSHEKWFAVPLLVSSVALFYLGTSFSYLWVFPLISAFFAIAILARWLGFSKTQMANLSARPIRNFCSMIYAKYLHELRAILLTPG